MPRPTTLLWLLAYFTLNLTLTLYNKLVLTRFPFPYTLTALHALCGTAGSYALVYAPRLGGGVRRVFGFVGRRGRRSRRGHEHGGLGLGGGSLTLDPEKSDALPRPKSLTEYTPLLLFSTLYTLNIVLSNASLRLVTVPFHQCVRASAPIFVLAIQYLISSPTSPPHSLQTPTSPSSAPSVSSKRNPNPRRKPTLTRKHLALLPVILGVALATYGDYYFTWPGFALTLAGTALAALKTVVTGALVGGGSRSRLGGRERSKEVKGGREREGRGLGGNEEGRMREDEKNTPLFAHPSPYMPGDVIYETPLPRVSRPVPSPLRSPTSLQHHDISHKTSQDPETTETYLYPPNQLSPKSATPFRFPTPQPLPSPSLHSYPSLHSVHPVSQQSSTSSTSSTSTEPTRPRALTYSAFNPGPVDDGAPSIPGPPLPSSPSVYPTTPPGGASGAERASKATQRRPPYPPSPARFYRHHAHHPPVSSEYEGEDEEDQTEKGWKIHKSTPSRVFVSALDRAKRRLRSSLRVSSLSVPSPFSSPFFSKLKIPSLPALTTLRTTLASKLDIAKPTQTYTPLHLLALLSPLAFVQCVALAWGTGELARVRVFLCDAAHGGVSGGAHHSILGIFGVGSGLGLGGNWGAGMRRWAMGRGLGGERTSLLLNGVLAFALNVASFGANRRVGAVGMSVAANTKQALAVLLSIALFDLALGPANALGVGMALLGGGVYAWPGSG